MNAIPPPKQNEKIYEKNTHTQTQKQEKIKKQNQTKTAPGKRPKQEYNPQDYCIVLVYYQKPLMESLVAQHDKMLYLEVVPYFCCEDVLEDTNYTDYTRVNKR